MNAECARYVFANMLLDLGYEMECRANAERNKASVIKSHHYSARLRQFADILSKASRRYYALSEAVRNNKKGPVDPGR
jgi:hypothetical protein